MTGIEYQNKIISLLDDLAAVFEDIAWTLHEMNWQHGFESKRVPLKENENKLKKLRDEIKRLLEEAYSLTQNIDSSIKKNEKFVNVEEVSEKIQHIVSYTVRADSEYKDAIKNNLLDESISNNRKSLERALSSLSEFIAIYNEKFNPKLKSLRSAFDVEKRHQRESLEQLYEDVFGEKFPN